MICEKFVVMYDAVGTCERSGLSLTDLLLNPDYWWRLHGLSIWGYMLLGYGLYKGYKYFKERNSLTS